jgi:sugar lactone lactonase YvrE
VLFFFPLNFEAQQASVALPYTMTTIGGLAPMAATSGTQCPGLPAGVVSTDAFGDGCLAINGILGSGAYSGVVADSFGNVFVNDDIKGVLHLINPASGIMTLVAGGGTACSSKLDSSGDGCMAATGTSTSAIIGARGVGIDPYGNILVSGYNDHFVHLICRNASPLCVAGTASPSAASPIQISVGNMGLVAGCAYATGSAGVSAAGTDNTPGFSTASALFTGSPFVNAGGATSACTASLGEVDQPRGVTADVYGNVYYADTASERLRVVLGPQSYNGVANPLWPILEENSSWPTVTAGYVYTIANTGTTATTANSQTHCNGNTSNPSPFATDTHGDGCLFTSASVNSSTSGTQGVAVDAAGNVIFTDAGNGLLRVFYVSNGSNFPGGTAGFVAGQAMQNAINVNNDGYSNWISPTTGFVYMLAGAGSGSATGSVSTTPRLGYSTTSLSSGITKVTVSPQGNIFIGFGSTTAASNKVLFFDIDTGYIRTLFATAASNVAAGSFCSGSSGPISLSAYSDGCPASSSEFGGSSASGALSVAADGQGNLYLYDGTSSTSGQLVRKILAQGFAPQKLRTAQQQIFEAHLLGATSATSVVTNSANPDLSYGSPSCTLHADNSVDCTVAVTSTPSAPGLRSATLTVSNASSGTDANIGLEGTVPGSVLAFDNASTTTNGVSTPIAPASIPIFSSIVPSSVAVDGAGNVYAASGESILESIGGSTYALSSSLPATPSQIAVDSVGNVFVVNAGVQAIEELAISAAGTPGAYNLTSISYKPASGTAAPQAIAVDNVGNLYVADYQSTGASIYRLSLAANTVRQQVTVASGLSDPVSLAVDASGNVYVADKGTGKVFEYSPGTSGSYALNATRGTLLSSVTPAAVAVDPAGDVYVQSGTSVLEVPVTGFETTVLTGLQNPAGLAVDGLGNVYSADSSVSSIIQVVRDAGSYGSTTSNVTSIQGTLTNVGNLTATGIVQTGSPADFTLAPSGCTVSTSSSFASGQACTVTASLSSSVLANSGASYTESLSFLAAPTAIGSVSFSDLVPIGPTSTTVSGPSNPRFAASGTEATFTVAVAGIASPSGSPVTVTVNSVTLQGTAPVFSTTPTLDATGSAMVNLSGLSAGTYTISASYAGVTNTYAASSAQAPFTVEQWVATGDARTVTEPVFPAACTQLNAALTSVNDDIPTSVDATVTNPDGARIQAALNSCAGTGQAVELSIDGAGHNAYLTGPLSMPSNVTLLVDPGVYVYFSRNVQDYDKVAGTHTCGTVNSASATKSCLPLIEIPGNSTNVGIMGFGKFDGRGGDTLINAFPSAYAGQSWWGLSSIANSGGSQQNPRFIQMDTGATNITLYKITLRNSPLFHISTTGAVTGFTAWDIKIVTPTSSRNTDGIDPGNAQNFTITRSWISDGDDNIAVGAANTVPAENISVTNNHFFAGHGESIGSYTTAGVSNILFDGNMSSGNGIAGSGSSINNTADTNSIGLRIKSGYDRGGVVTNVQYSNSCYQDHKAEIVFSPNYEATTGTLSPNINNILLQNLSFVTAGTVQFTGTSNNGTINMLQVMLDNVSFPNPFPVSEFSPAPTNTELIYGPGQVSTDFIADFATFVGVGGNSVINNITEPALAPPTCNFTYLAPELTGPAGQPQTITEGQNATAVVILTPAVGGATYPTGTVTLTDALTSASTTVTLTGTSDTIFIPLTGLSVGTHTFTATYSGDSNYTLTAGQTVYSMTAPYVITVNPGSLATTTTTLSGVPSSAPFGDSVTATATVVGSSPTGTLQFVVNGSVYATVALTSGSATASITLPFSTSPYSIYAVYNGDSANDGSTSGTSPLTITQANTVTALAASATTATLGHPIALTATVTALVGTPTGTVTFTYTTTGSSTPVATSAILNNGVATAGVTLPVGTDSVTATYAASGSYAGSTSAPMAITVSVGTILALPANPIPLPYTMTTIAGGAAANCSSATDSFGDGCPATSIVFGGSLDLRSVVADPFGNVYLTDSVSNLVRRIAPNGVISNFAGRVTGTACVPTATIGCTPTLVSMNKPRGVSADSQGNIYIAGYNTQEVFKVSVSSGLMYLVAGTGTAGGSGDGGAASAAQVNGPRSVWADTVGNVYIADTSNNKIRVVDITGNIHTFAGNGTAGSIGDGSPATSAEISNPQGVMTDANLNVYIADSAKVRVVCVTCGTGSPLDALLAMLGIASPQNGYIYTIAGGASSSYSGTYPTLATSVIMSPQKLAIDGSGNIYISDGSGAVWFVDSRTGNIRPIAGNTTTNCSSATDSFGDGCPATQAVIGDGGNGIGVGTDTLGNIYISDTLNARIRKVTTGLASTAIATGSSATQPVEIHFIAGDAPASTNALSFASTEWSLGTPACATNADTTTDCLVTSTFTPAVPGARSTPLAVNSSLGNTANLALTGTGLGAGTTLDPASQISFGANLQVVGLATDTAGNVYVADANSKSLLRFTPSAQSQGAGATSTTLATLTAPGPVAVDPRGFVYVGDTSTGLITQIAPSGATSALALTLTTPAGLAVDALNNLYVSDSSAQAVYQLNPITGAVHALAVGTFVAPAGLAIDPAGNLLITDPGEPAIYRFNLQSGVTTTVSSTAVKPSAIATDAAGNLLIADTASILAAPASANSTAFTVASLTPSALAIDSAGNLYTGSGSAVLKLTRTQGYVQFAGASAPPQTVSLLESGNQALQLSSISQTDTADYSLAAAASTDCTVTGALPSTVAVGGVCALTATYTPTTFLTTTDTATFNGNLANAALSTPSSVQLVLTAPASAPAATIALGAFSPASPVFGQTVTASATVSGPSITPTGTVVFTVDSSTISATVVNGVATASLTGLSVGTHTVSAAYTSSNGFTSAATSAATLTVGQATATVTLSNLSQTYTGSPLSATATTTPSGLAVSLTYNGSPTAPTVAGSYAVVATATDPSYTGTATGTLVIAQATATVNLSNLSQTYTGSPLSATATTTPTGLAVSLTYNGSSTAPTAAGSYTVVATINDPNYTGTTTGTLVIAKATATVTLSNLSQTYTGSPLSATATTTPAGLAVSLTYNGSATAPTAAGSYTVVATVNDPNYTGTATGTLVIAKATATVTLSNLSHTYTGSPLSAIATTTPAGLAVSLTYNGSATAPTTAGSYAVVATINDPNYTGTATGTLVIAKATATVTLSNLSQTYTGSPLSATATTTPAGLAVSLTYNGSATAPTAAGSYAVVATINDPNYTGTATGTLVIAKATATVTLSNLSQTYTGSSLSAIATTTPTGLAVSLTYNGSATAPTTAGSYAVVATINDPNYTGTATGTLVIAKATATVTLSNLSQTYTGSPLSATATTTPTGLAVSFTYNGSATAPTAAGSFAVVATVNNPNYAGSASGTLTIAKAAASVTFFANPASPTQGKSDLLTATVTGAGQPSGTVVFSSGATTLCTATLNASGVGSCSFIPSKDGNLSVTAQYQGDSNHLTSSTSLTLFVYDSAVTLQLASTQLVYPGATNVTVCITPATKATATGTVQIYDGTTLIATLTLQSNGCAYWYISPGLNAGTHSLTAVYSGDKNNPSGTSDPVTVTVSPVPVTLSATCWNVNFAYGANYQCVVTLSSSAGPPLGSIAYTYDSGSPVTVPLNSGIALFTLTKPNVGTHKVVVSYAQQTNYAAGTPQTETFTVTPAPVIVSLTPSTRSAKVGTSITFLATVSSSSAGPPDATGAVSFYNGATLLSTVPVNAGGQASYATASLSAGTHTITATYAGGTNYASGSGSATVTITQ